MSWFIRRTQPDETDLPIELDLEALRAEEPDRDRLKEIFLALEFHSLVRDYAAPEPKTPAERKVEYGLVQTPAQADFRTTQQGYPVGLTDPARFNPLTANITYMPPDYRSSNVQSWFASVQREVWDGGGAGRDDGR